MKDYETLARELISDHLRDRLEWAHTTNDELTRREVLEQLLEDTENVFGNIDGSRTCSSYEARQFIDKSGAVWDEDIIDLYAGIGDDYMAETIKRGPEVFDVVTLELLAPQVISEMLEAEQ